MNGQIIVQQKLLQLNISADIHLSDFVYFVVAAAAMYICILDQLMMCLLHLLSVKRKKKCS